MNHYSIKDVEALTGIKPHTLRIWEQRYGIPHPQRTSTNIRFYDNDDLRFLLSVAMLNRQGFKISKITQMSRVDLDKAVIELSENTDDNAVLIESLTNAMLGLNEIAFEKILSANILQYGLEEAFINLIFPLLMRIGLLWQTGRVNPAYEHFISNLIRQKLFTACDALPKHIHPDSKKFILFLPSGETHEIGLLYANYLIRKNGHHTSYLGINLPMDDLAEVMKVYKADFILTVLTSSISNQSSLLVAKKLSADFPKTTILISGSQVAKEHVHLPKNAKFLYSFNDLSSLLDSLRIN